MKVWLPVLSVVPPYYYSLIFSWHFGSVSARSVYWYSHFGIQHRLISNPLLLCQCRPLGYNIWDSELLNLPWDWRTELAQITGNQLNLPMSSAETLCIWAHQFKHTDTHTHAHTYECEEPQVSFLKLIWLHLMV